MGRDVVNLTWGGHIDQVIGLHLDLVTRGQEGVETHDKVWVALEQLGHSADDSWSVNTKQT